MAELEDATTSVSEGPKSIVVVELPDELANRELLQRHFSQYGNIERMTCSLKHHYAIIHFSSGNEAARAKAEGTVIDPTFQPMKVYMSNRVPAGGPVSLPMKKKTSSLKSSAVSLFKGKRRVTRISSSESSEASDFTSARRSSSEENYRQAKKVSVIGGVKTNPFGPSPQSIVAAKTLKQALEKAQSSASVKPSPVFMRNEPINLDKTTPAPVDIQKKTYDLLYFNPDTVEAQKLFGKKYVTAEERYRALEARDKLLRARIPKGKVRVELATRLFGTCRDMCPEKERYMRQYQRQLTSFETVDGPDFAVDHHKAVKVYSRSSADQEEPLPHELRPASTLDMTLYYLLKYIVPLANSNEEILGDWYNFLWDRTRSIRKDITQQQLTNLNAVGLMEKCARFHIHCSSRLCELDLHSFEPKLNDENLMKCLQSLEHLYDDLRRRKIKCPNEPEFRAYQIMMNLNEGDILWDIQQRPAWILGSPEVRLALRLHHAIYNKNFVAFFRMVERSPYMVSCILHRYFYQVRTNALHSLTKSSKLEAQMSLVAVQRMLGYTNALAEFRHLCEAHGMFCDVINDRLVMNKSKFSQPDARIVSREMHLIESKLNTSVEEAINGEPLGQNLLENYHPQSSFDADGYLVPGPVAGGSSTSGVPSLHVVQTPSQTSTSLLKSRDESDSKEMPSVGFSFGPLGSSQDAKPQSSHTEFSFTRPTAPVSGPGGIFGRKKLKSDPNQRPVSEIPIPPKSTPVTLTTERKAEIVNEVINEIAEQRTKDLVDEEVTKVIIASFDEVRRQQREQMQRIKEDILINSLVEQAADKFVETEMLVITTKVVKKQIRKTRILNYVCAQEAMKMLNTVENHLIRRILEGVLWTAKKDQAELIDKATPIFRRIKLRMILHKWLRNAQKKRQQRQLQEEKLIHNRLDFPASNPMRKSNQDILNVLRGNEKRSPNIVKGGQGTSSLLDKYERLEALSEGFLQTVNSLCSAQNLERPKVPVSTERPRAGTDAFNIEYCNRYWKRRWPEEPITMESDQEQSRGVKSPKMDLHSNVNSACASGTANGLKDGAKLKTSCSINDPYAELLHAFQAVIDEARSEKKKTLDPGGPLNL